MTHIEGAYHLKHLKYLVIKKKPKDKEEFKKQILKLCKYSPIKRISLTFAKYKKSSNHHNDYWKNLQSMTVKQIKDKMSITDHPNLILIEREYLTPSDIPKLNDKTKFSEYKPHRLYK